MEKYIGKCSNCGKDDVEVVIVDEEAHLCEDCLDNDYFFCDECKEYWHCDYVESYELEDGRTVCEHCYEDIDDIDENPVLAKLIHDISENEDLSNNVYSARGIYFVVVNDAIYEISDDASCSPRGGWFPDIVKGPSDEEAAFISKCLEKYDIDEYFFDEYLEDAFEYDEDSALEYFEENDEDALKVFKALLKAVEKGNTPFETMDDLISAFRRFGLDGDTLYYEWEGDWIPFYDNICETGEGRGYYDSLSDDEWIKILENVIVHKVEG